MSFTDASSPLSPALFFALYALLGFLCLFVLLFIKLIILHIQDRFFPPKPRTETPSQSEDLSLTADTRSVYRFSSFTHVYALFILLIPLLVLALTFVNPVHNERSLILLTFMCGSASLYLYYLGSTPTQRIFFEQDHIYFGTTRANAFCESDYMHMYYLTTPVEFPLSLFQYVDKPTLIVFRKKIRFPLFFYYLVDRFFPASNANRQVLFMLTWNLEKGHDERIIQNDDNQFGF